MNQVRILQKMTGEERLEVWAEKLEVENLLKEISTSEY